MYHMKYTCIYTGTIFIIMFIYGTEQMVGVLDLKNTESGIVIIMYCNVTTFFFHLSKYSTTSNIQNCNINLIRRLT